MTRLIAILAASVVAALMTSPAHAGWFDLEDVPKTSTKIPLPLEPAPAPLASPRRVPAPQLGAPVPYAQVTPAPMAVPGERIHVAPPLMAPVFHRVKYEDLDNIHPCGIPVFVQVPDPWACDCRHCNACCAPQLVSIKICVPPGPCRRVKVRHGGRRIKYDYGKYEVEIKVRDGYVKVDYDD